jgi:hypothetical protein
MRIAHTSGIAFHCSSAIAGHGYITNVDTEIVNTIWLVIQAVRNKSGYADLGIRNFMMRGDTLVFTDSLA